MGFTYAGIHSNTYKVRLLKVDRGLLPPTRDQEIAIPGRHGVWDFGAEFGKRIIEMECGIMGTDRADLLAQARLIAEWLNPLQGVQQLVFDDEPSKFFKARYSGQAPLEMVIGFGRFTLQFACPDPFAYSVADDVFTYNTPGTYNFNRQGTAPSYPQIEITGNSGGGAQTITVQLNGKAITYSGALSAGQTLVLDSDNLTVYRNTAGGTVNGLGSIDALNFGVAQPGANSLTVSVAGGSTVSQIAVTCRSRWY